MELGIEMGTRVDWGWFGIGGGWERGLAGLGWVHSKGSPPSGADPIRNSRGFQSFFAIQPASSPGSRGTSEWRAHDRGHVWPARV